MMTAHFSSPLALCTVVISTAVADASTLSERLHPVSSHQRSHSPMSAIFDEQKAMICS